MIILSSSSLSSLSSSPSSSPSSPRPLSSSFLLLFILFPFLSSSSSYLTP
jgi:hypothetical protein